MRRLKAGEVQSLGDHKIFNGDKQKGEMRISIVYPAASDAARAPWIKPPSARLVKLGMEITTPFSSRLYPRVGLFL